VNRLNATSPHRRAGARTRCPLRRVLVAAGILLAGALPAANAFAQQQQIAANPEAALSDALSAACRQDAATFANSLVADDAAAFRALPVPQRTAVMKRFVLLEDAGRTLLSTSADGRMVVRCESPGFLTEMRFGVTRLRENLAFVPIEVPITGEPARTITFGLVRESGNWKLLSVGLLLLDIPTMAKQWEQADLDAKEDNAIANLRAVASALETYRRAYGKLPDSLELLGPAPPGGVSADTAGLVDANLAAGNKDGYTIRYNILPADASRPDADANRDETFNLVASPEMYGKNGRRSFFLDSSGVLRGADKKGGVATSTDARIGPS
jgi:hypothetical protein